MDDAAGLVPPREDDLSRGNATQQQDQGVQNVGGSMKIGAINFHGLRDDAGEQKKALLRLLAFSNMSNRKDTIERTYRQTCEWFLQSPEFIDWRARKSGLLWIKGNPGAGKSTMMKFVIRNIQKTPGEKVVSHFFNARGSDLEQSAEGLCQSLLVQLLHYVPSHVFAASDVLYTASQEHADKTWALPRLLELLEEVIFLLRPSPITIFVDAVDECIEQQLQTMVDSLCDLLEETESDASLRICFASRYFPHITRHGATELLLEHRKEHYQDVRRYIAGQLSSSRLQSRPQLHHALQARAGGSFIWAFLVIRFLKEENRRGKVGNWEAQIEMLPVKLEELYRTILNRHQESRDETLMCYKWVLATRRHLNLRELWWAIRLSCTDEAKDVSISTEYENMTIEDLERRILDISRGLVAVSEEGSRVQFIHETAREFAMKETDLQSEVRTAQTHETFKVCCWRAILRAMNHRQQLATTGEADDSLDPATTPREEMLKKHPLSQYAAEEILHHADEAQDGDIDQSAFLDELWRNKKPLGQLCVSVGSSTSRDYGASTMISMLVLNDRTNLIFKCRSQIVAARENNALGLEIDSGKFAAITLAIQQKCLLAIGALMALHVNRRAGYPALCNLLGQLGERACEEMWNTDAIVGLDNTLTFYPDALFDLADFHDDVATFFLISTLPPDSRVVAKEQLPKVSQVARNGFGETLRYLLQESVTFSPPPISYAGLCSWAAARGHVALLKHSLREGADASTRTLTDELTPLDLAVREGQVSIIKELQRRHRTIEPSSYAHGIVVDRQGRYPYIEIAEVLSKWHHGNIQGLKPSGALESARDERPFEHIRRNIEKRKRLQAAATASMGPLRRP